MILLLALVLAALPLQLHAQNSQFMCSAPQNNVLPCTADTPFSPISEPIPNLTIGNPVNLVSGEKYLQEVDLPEPLARSWPPFMRFYRSQRPTKSAFGQNWQSLYDIKATQIEHNTWQISFANGASFRFTGQISSRGILSWHSANNRSLSFNSKGQLIIIQDQNLGVIKLDYHQSGPFQAHIKTIIQGPYKLEPSYIIIDKQILIASLDTPVGKFEYHYDKQLRLAKVIRPDNMYRTYTYADTTSNNNLITAITINSPEHQSWPVRNWQYDDQARVISASPGTQPTQKLQIKYLDQGRPLQTQIKSANASSTIMYKYINGSARLIQQQTAGLNTDLNQHSIKYDALGRLQQINDLQIKRYRNGNIKQLLQTDSGWPDLQLNYAADGKLNSWYSTLTGITKYSYDNSGILQTLQYANGDQTAIKLDHAQRPVSINYTGSNKADIAVKLGWYGDKLIRLEHPNETEYRQFNHNEQLSKRTVIRANAIQYDESFDYNQQGQLTGHQLPEGGKLIYQWRGNKIRTIKWLSPTGQEHLVLSTDNAAGYKYGNGLQMQMMHNQQQSSLVLNQDNTILWAELRRNDKQGRLQHSVSTTATGLAYNTYGYDDFSRTIAVTSQTENSLNSKNLFLSWHNNGSLKAHNGDQAISKIQRDHSGLPIAFGNYQLQYQAQQRLAKVTANGQELASYQYNAQGLRIFQKYQHLSAHRLYLDNKLVAIWELANNRIIKRQRFIYAHHMVIGLIETEASGSSKLYFVHNNQLGAPVLVSDQAQNIVWQASYDLFGRAHITKQQLNMPIRLPGQDEDPLTGWHDNVFRTYIPALGQYFEPDPLGPLPGQQALGYARQQPRRYTDRLGLLLLAFDGTNNSAPNNSNIWKLSQAYAGPSYYHKGPGDSFSFSWDAVNAASARQIQANQWQSLLDGIQLAKNQQQRSVPIDLLGYSRGAALARDFANQIVANTNSGWFSYNDPIRGNISICIDLRFMGLFDTVAQFGIVNSANANYNFKISDAWLWVAHAVAANEYRALFPVISIMAENNTNTIEVPFIGAHADIGGGMLLDDNMQPIENGDLSDVALNWMFWQASAALVPLAELKPTEQFISNAILHDERSAISNAIFQDDRFVQDSQTNIISHQAEHPQLGRQQRDLFERFILRADANNNVAGVIDMQAYNAWLQEHYGMPSVYN